MEQIFSRRGFLKGAAAAALAVSAMGLTGCSTDAGAEPSTAVILGDYKVDLDLKRSVLGKNGDGSATVKLSVFVTNTTPVLPRCLSSEACSPRCMPGRRS